MTDGAVNAGTIVSNISILFDIAHTYKLRVYNHLQNFLQLNKFDNNKK